MAIFNSKLLVYQRVYNWEITIIIVSKGNHPQMAARFRLVKYYEIL